MFLQELTILLDRAAEELAGGTVSRRGADLEQSSLSGCGIEESKCRDCEQEEILWDNVDGQNPDHTVICKIYPI